MVHAVTEKLFTIADAKAVFSKLLVDERIPYALTNSCEKRREIMIGIMLTEMGVPKENLGRILVRPKDATFHSITTLRPDVMLNDRVYLDDAKTKRRIKAQSPGFLAHLEPDISSEYAKDTMRWPFHTAVTVKFYNPSLKESVEMVMDPHINPTRMLTIPEFVDYLARRCGGAKMDVEHASLQQECPLMSQAAHGGITDWNCTKDEMSAKVSNLLQDLEGKIQLLRQQGLLGAAFIAKWEHMHDFAVRGL